MKLSKIRICQIHIGTRQMRVIEKLNTVFNSKSKQCAKILKRMKEKSIRFVKDL